jgi:nitrite reductase/ring-hydroxylating ferredoxin subunit
VADGPGRAHVSEDPLRIACPWHGWEYDLDSGQSFMGPGEAGVRSYGVGTAPGQAVLAEIEAGATQLRPGPYVAETFEVRVEDDYVVLDA